MGAVSWRSTFCRRVDLEQDVRGRIGTHSVEHILVADSPFGSTELGCMRRPGAGSVGGRQTFDVLLRVYTKCTADQQEEAKRESSKPPDRATRTVMTTATAERPVTS